MSSAILCGVDTGGTFTDCVLVVDGRIVRAKAPSTPGDFSVGFFDALTGAAEQLGLTLEDLVPRLSRVVYGTTVATNILVQRNGARTGLLTTKGFRDTLLLMRGIGRVTGVPPEQIMHVAATSKPVPLIPRALTAEVPERVDCFGEIVQPIDEGGCRQAIEGLLADGVEAIAIAFLWSFMNPGHELRARELVREAAPGVYVTCSAELSPRWGEYERTVTAAINAYVGPPTERYMGRVAERANRLGVRREPLILQCNGGATPIREAVAGAVHTIGSGPAAGVIASVDLAVRLGLDHVICADVGGTTFDVGLIRDRLPVTTDTSVVSQYRYYAPAIDVQSIGAGGGSVAWFDAAARTMRVGPLSAGADPGPACYGRGGTKPTVTDACLVLGYLGVDRPLAGQIELNREHAVRVVAELAGKVGMSTEAAAAGIVHIAEMHMADLIRKMTIHRGFDPSEFVLLAYGGGGPVHAGGFGAELGVRRIVIPLGDNSSLWSAFGAAASDVRRVFEVSRIVDAPLPTAELTALFTDLEYRGREWLSAQGFPESEIELSRHAELRYKAQVNQVSIPVRSGSLGSEEGTEIVDSFERAYAGLYGEGTGYRAAGIELTSVSVDAVGRIERPPLIAGAGVETTVEPGAMRPVWWSEQQEFVDTAVYDGEALRPGGAVTGPAIVEFLDTTLVVHVAQRAVADVYGNVELARMN